MNLATLFLSVMVAWMAFCVCVIVVLIRAQRRDLAELKRRAEQSAIKAEAV
jgi:hypothetical protein